MIGLDTNVIVRYLTQDHAGQSASANILFEQTLTHESPGFVSLVALVEMVWVLESGYACERPQIISILERLLRSKTLVVERTEVVWQAVRQFASSRADFADCLIERSGASNACDYTITFDRLAARTAGMRLLS